MNLMNKPPPGQRDEKPKNGTAKGRRHMGKVKSLPCVCCGRYPPSDAHHCRSGGMPRDDFKTIPLCKNHHQGGEGYHTQKRTWEDQYGPDHGFLELVEKMIEDGFEIDF